MQLRQSSQPGRVDDLLVLNAVVNEASTWGDAEDVVSARTLLYLAQPELRLTRDGWEVHGGDYDHLPLPVNAAYEAAGFDQRVLDETRKLCRDLRFEAKKNRTVRKTLEELRAGLADAAKLKAEREAA
jgi:hypothetical protein